jgi:hypothetical protein
MGIRAFFVAAAIGAWASTAAATPVANQVNTFQGGGNAGWTNGGGAADPVVVSTGGPGGAGDAFLRVTANGGGGAGSKLVTINESTAWTGNFATAGVTAVSMDLKNFGTSPLSMRVALEESGSGGTHYVSNPPFTLPADGAWHTATFPLTSAGLTSLNGGTPLATGLTRITEFRILDNPSLDFRGASIASSFGVDNIRAVPEPGAALLVAAVVPLLWRRTLRRTRGFSNRG